MKKKKIREMKAKYYESLRNLNKRIEEDKNANKVDVPEVDNKELKDYTKKELIEYASNHNISLPNIDKMKKDMIKYVNQNSKDSFNAEESAKLIKFSMNWYTAALKSITYNFRALSTVTKKYLDSMKEKNKKSNESNKGE